MLVTDIGTTKEEAFAFIRQKKMEIYDRLKKGQTEESIAIGGTSYTRSEWKGLVEKIDKTLDEAEKEQKERIEKMNKETKAKELYEKMSG
jgi:hypothetical protein